MRVPVLARVRFEERAAYVVGLARRAGEIDGELEALARVPRADRLPGSSGTSTRRMPSSAAIWVACIGPAPPNGTRVKRAGS